MKRAHWLGFFVGAVLAPGVVCMIFMAPLIAVLGFLGGPVLFDNTPPVTLVLGWGLIGIMVGGPVALVGAILCTLSSKVFGHFSFPQALAAGLLVAWPLAAGLGNKDPAIAWSLFAASAISICAIWGALKWLGGFPHPIEAPRG